MTERPYWDMEIEPKLNTPEIRALQWEKLQYAIRYCYDKVPFDRQRMDKASIKPEDIGSFDDFARALPHAGQPEMRELVEELGGDLDRVFGALFGKERSDDLYLLTTTSGTTGIPTPYPFFRKGVERQIQMVARSSWRMGIRPGDRIGLCFGLSMHAAGTPHLLWYLDYPGVTMLPIGAEAGTERILQLIKLFKVNVFTGTPSLALHLIECAPDVLGEPVASLGLKILACGAEPGAGIPEVRQRLEQEYGAKVFDVGAGIGASCEHPTYQGMHWLADDFAYYELIDPNTHEPVPLEHGATGLAVVTPLEPEHALFFFNLRVTLGDIHQVFTDPCPCGRSGFRYRIVGRSDDMLKVKGVPVYPAAIEGVIHAFVPRVTGAFRIVLDERPPRVVPPLKLKIERGRDLSDAELGGLEEEIREKMHKDVKVRPAITWLAPDTLERATKKTQLVEISSRSSAT